MFKTLQCYFFNASAFKRQKKGQNIVAMFKTDVSKQGVEKASCIEKKREAGKREASN